MDLTIDELRFLREQKIPLSQVFDGRALSKIDRETEMKSLEMNFYIGSPCNERSHRLRTRKGHCIQCKTERIAYQLRSSDSGYVYLAYSDSGKCAKVGMTSVDAKFRVSILAQSGYAGQHDWRLIEHKLLNKGAGRTEFKIHSLLSEYQKPVGYLKQGNEVLCSEVFFCDIDIAKNTFNSNV
jgi:hypothetical protein